MKKKILIIGAVILAIILGIVGFVYFNKEDDAKTNEIADDGTKVVTAKELLSVYDFDIDDYVKLCDYDNITVESSRDYTVTEEQIQSYIESMLSYGGSYEKTDKQNVEMGDVVNVDYTGYMDGSPLEGASDSGTHLEIGSNSMIAGFEDGLVGHKVGETVELNLTFPDDYWSEAQQGKDITFQVKINYIEKSTTPTYEELTDEYVQDNYEYASVQEWHDSIQASLESSAEQQKYSELQLLLVNEIIEKSEITIPDTLLESELEETIRQIEIYAKDNMNGMSLEDYLSEYEECSSVDEYKTKITPEITTMLESQLVIDAIIKDTNQSITEGGYINFLTYYLESYGMEEEAFYERYGSKENIQLIYAENLVTSSLVDKIVGATNNTDEQDPTEMEDSTESSKSTKKKITITN